jgi:hypothetical protein
MSRFDFEFDIPESNSIYCWKDKKCVMYGRAKCLCLNARVKCKYLGFWRVLREVVLVKGLIFDY